VTAARAQVPPGAADSRGVKGFLGIRWSVGRKLGLAFGGVVCFLLGISIVALHTIGTLTATTTV
jgi:hypothetical protein